MYFHTFLSILSDQKEVRLAAPKEMQLTSKFYIGLLKIITQKLKGMLCRTQLKKYCRGWVIPHVGS